MANKAYQYRQLCHLTPPAAQVILHVLPPLQALQSKDGDEGADAPEPMSAVQMALKRQQAQGPPPGFHAVPEPAGTWVAAVAAASHGHLHMPLFEKVDIGTLTWCRACFYGQLLWL
jgi:hypothetical protein